MPEEPEIETNELRETVGELQEELSEERKEREEEREKERAASAWTRWIALSTALLAVFAAIGALQSGALVNEAMVDQLKASDTWNEYQAARQKEYLFTLTAEGLLDRQGVAAKIPSPPSASKEEKHEDSALHALPPGARLAEYLGQIRKEQEKEPELRAAAEEHEKSAEEGLHRHHLFAWSVALIQVAIALSAIAALTKLRPVWAFSLLLGAGGVVLFALGLLPPGAVSGK